MVILMPSHTMHRPLSPFRHRNLLPGRVQIENGMPSKLFLVRCVHLIRGTGQSDSQLLPPCTNSAAAQSLETCPANHGWTSCPVLSSCECRLRLRNPSQRADSVTREERLEIYDAPVTPFALESWTRSKLATSPLTPRRKRSITSWLLRDHPVSCHSESNLAGRCLGPAFLCLPARHVRQLLFMEQL